jgi:hypothetical protein
MSASLGAEWTKVFHSICTECSKPLFYTTETEFEVAQKCIPFCNETAGENIHAEGNATKLAEML